jgi:hypothetical protein
MFKSAHVIGLVVIALLVAGGLMLLRARAQQVHHFDPAQITQIVIEDGWDGEGPIRPIRSTLILNKTASGFAGDVTHRVGGYQSIPVTDTASVSITTEAMAPLFAELSVVPLRPGVYKPAITYLDNLPKFAITLHTPTETLTFISMSQNDDLNPMGAELNGVPFTSETDVLGRASKRVLPFMRLEMRATLVDQLIRAK